MKESRIEQRATSGIEQGALDKTRTMTEKEKLKEEKREKREKIFNSFKNKLTENLNNNNNSYRVSLCSKIESEIGSLGVTSTSEKGYPETRDLLKEIHEKISGGESLDEQDWSDLRMRTLRNKLLAETLESIIYRLHPRQKTDTPSENVTQSETRESGIQQSSTAFTDQSPGGYDQRHNIAREKIREAHEKIKKARIKIGKDKSSRIRAIENVCTKMQELFDESNESTQQLFKEKFKTAKRKFAIIKDNLEDNRQDEELKVELLQERKQYWEEILQLYPENEMIKWVIDTINEDNPRWPHITEDRSHSEVPIQPVQVDSSQKSLESTSKVSQIIDDANQAISRLEHVMERHNTNKPVEGSNSQSNSKESNEEQKHKNKLLERTDVFSIRPPGRRRWKRTKESVQRAQESRRLFNPWADVQRSYLRSGMNLGRESEEVMQEWIKMKKDGKEKYAADNDFEKDEKGIWRKK